MRVNPFSRLGVKRPETLGVVLHYTGVEGLGANGVWVFFGVDCQRDRRYAGTQYIVGLEGDVIRTMPDDEAAYHCGSDQKDPASGRVYTDWGRAKFGRYCIDSLLSGKS